MMIDGLRNSDIMAPNVHQKGLMGEVYPAALPDR